MLVVDRSSRSAESVGGSVDRSHRTDDGSLVETSNSNNRLNRSSRNTHRHSRARWRQRWRRRRRATARSPTGSAWTILTHVDGTEFAQHLTLNFPSADRGFVERLSIPSHFQDADAKKALRRAGCGAGVAQAFVIPSHYPHISTNTHRTIESKQNTYIQQYMGTPLVNGCIAVYRSTNTRLCQRTDITNACHHLQQMHACMHASTHHPHCNVSNRHPRPLGPRTRTPSPGAKTLGLDRPDHKLSKMADRVAQPRFRVEALAAPARRSARKEKRVQFQRNRHAHSRR